MQSVHVHLQDIGFRFMKIRKEKVVVVTLIPNQK